MSKPANIAVVGYGYWGENIARNVASLGALHIICDTNPERLAKATTTHPDIICTSDYNQILASKRVSGVIVSCPTDQHHIIARQAILAGKDIFVEKPFTLKVTDAEDLLALSATQKRIAMVGHILIYHPAVQRLKQCIDRGDLGEIYYMYSVRVNLGQVRSNENAWWRLAPHDIAMLAYLLSCTPQVVSAQAYAYLRPDRVDVAFASLRLGNAVAHIQVSWLDPRKVRQLTVVGSDGMAVFDDTITNGKLKVYDKGIDRDSSQIREDGAYIPVLDSVELLQTECKAFLHSIETREPPITDARQGLEVVKVLDAASRLMESCNA